MYFSEEFIQRMDLLSGGKDWQKGYASPRRRGLRVNTLKCPVGKFQELWTRTYGETLEPTPFAPNTFYVGESHRAGADPLHHAGAYYMQEPSATAAVAALDPQPGERLLDACAAPGGKATQIAAALCGQGLLWCNEYVTARARILLQNLERCGVENAVVSSTDCRALAQRLPGYFDGVLVDAPCSGEGMFRKEPAALAQWSVELVRQCAERGREILSAAAELVRPGGRLVYATCTFAPEEDECQIAAFLESHPDFELESFSLAAGSPGLPIERLAPFMDTAILHTSFPLWHSRRIWPGQGGEGHYIARLRRAADRETTPNAAVGTYPYPRQDREFSLAYRDWTGEELQGVSERFGRQIRLLPAGLPALRGLGVLAAGVAAATVCTGRLEPDHGLAMARGARFQSRLELSLADPRVTAYLRGEAIPTQTAAGWTAVLLEGIPLGLGKAGAGRLNNRYPKGLRLLAAAPPGPG